MFRRPPVALAGPAFIASVAYVDPGNVATNSVAGATSGYALAWVVVGAGLMAMPVQYVAAKVGIASGRSVPRSAREVMSRPTRVLMWVQAEIVAMATDVAEFLGAAVGLQLLFGLGLLESGLITAVISFGVLALQRRGHRPFEVGIIAFLAFIVAGVAFQLVSVGVDPGGLAAGLVPGFADSTQLVLAVGIVGATVMPHAIYAHSALTAGRVRGVGRSGRARLLGFQRTEVVVALSVASLVNLSMLLIAAGVFSGTPAAPGVDGLEAARRIVAGASGARVLMLTTFDLDAHVYDGLRAGAAGFLLKSAPPEHLVHAVHTVAAGDALLDPRITRRLIERFVARPSPAQAAGGVLARISDREAEVLRLIAAGLSNTEIARHLFVSEGTVKTHVNHLLRKLDLRDRVQAVVLAYESGISQPGRSA